MKVRALISTRQLLAALACATALASCGGGSGGSDNAGPARSGAGISLVAGNIGGPGNLDGVGDAARFNRPAGVTVDAAGNAYVVDAGNRSVRRVSASGEVSLLAGIPTPGDINFNYPQYDGDRTVALFNKPLAIALDPSRGLLYVTDDSLLRRVTLDGTVSTLNPFPADSHFSLYPSAVVVAPDGTPIIAAGKLPRGLRSCCLATGVFRFLEPGGPTLLAGSADAEGSADGQGAAARFQNIGAMAIDRAGNIYVADRSTLRKVTPDGAVSTVAGSLQTGFVDGTGAQARFGSALGLAIDLDGNMLVGDADNQSIRKVTPQGGVSTLYGQVPFLAGQAPGIAVNASGTILYTAPNGLSSAVQGNAAQLIAGTQPLAPSALFASNTHLVRDSQGNLFRAAADGSIRKFSPDGTTVLPFGPIGGDLRGQAPPKSLYQNVLSIDAADNLYQSYLTFEGYNATGGGVIRISSSGQSTVLVSSNSSSVAPFKPGRVTPDNAGNLYFIDDLGSTVRKLGPTGTLTTVADLSSASGLGSGTTGELALGVDRGGNLFINSVSGCVIYRINAAGLPVVFAGQLNQCGQVDGAATQAKLESPGAPVIDSAGTLYITNPNTIRRIAPDGTVTTIAGQAGRTGTRLGPLPGSLGTLLVSSLLVGADDSIYVVADQALLKITTR
jgi:hypothetical protein